MKNVTMKLGQRIQNKRTELGISITQLGELLKTSSIYLTRIENGVEDFQIQLLLRICKVLAINPKDLFD